MSVLLSYNPKTAEYRFSETHPLRPERFSLAVSLIDAWGLLDDAVDAAVVSPGPSSIDELLLAHDRSYIELVQQASKTPSSVHERGIGPGDTPAFAGMHDAAALAAGATSAAVRAVMAGDAHRAFAPAGGLHHAHRDHASGFCIYNDCVVAIECATREHIDLRVAYVDIDAHHGDGVEAAFVERPDVLTLSVHESGRYLFPGTGRATDIGIGAGRGAALNVPLPPFADESCYDLVVAEVIEPALRAFAPDLFVVQAGADSHRADPLTHLYQSVEGYCRVVARLISIADDVTDGRIVFTGGGGYLPYSEVPRMWAGVMALLLGCDVPRELPAEWLAEAATAARAAEEPPPMAGETFSEALGELDPESRETALQSTRHAVASAKAASPLL